MDDINKIISKLRITAFLLFLIPTFALFGSIYIHNFLINFNYEYSIKFDLNLDGKPGDFYDLKCDEGNKNCTSNTFIKTHFNEKFKKLDQCFKHKIKHQFYVNGKLYNESDLFYNYKKGIIKNSFENKNIFFRTYLEEDIDNTCIKNSKYLAEYKVAPFVFNYLYNLNKKKEFNLGTSNEINPLFVGDTSISNIVKRYPLKYFFKPLLYISSFLMVLYWFFYNKIFINYLKKDVNKFYYLGISSAFFLFLHVFFLGSVFEIEILNKIRRIFIVFFIFFELAAQVFLAKDLFIKREELNKYTNTKIIFLKVYFVTIICISSLIILTALVFINFESSVDYILEWNYFLILLIFYFLSSIIWKKLTNNPSTT